MKQKIRHIRAGRGEWVKVHRNHSVAGPGGNDWWVTPLVYLGAIGLGLYLLSDLLPFIFLGAMAWGVLKFSGR